MASASRTGVAVWDCGDVDNESIAPAVEQQAKIAAIRIHRSSSDQRMVI
jgi:hypothetical protein